MFFVDVPSGVRKAVLETIGSCLKHLSFFSCEDVYLSDLYPCIALEKLQIGYGSTVNSNFVVNETFLPNLKRFTSNVCLGKLGSLFEEERSLVSLNLDCSHLQTKVGKFCWNNIPFTWYDLENLSLSSTPGLRIEHLFSFIPKLKKLKQLSLPQFANNVDEKLVKHLKHQLKLKNCVLQMSFRPSTCIFKK